MRGEGGMGIDSGKKQHNPDRDNLKSLLKKPGRGVCRDGKKNRVVFNETKNEFFDADYIILIREECDYDDEDDDNVCTCNQHEMVRLTCCEPNCNCNVYDGYADTTPQSPKYAPPLEFVDAVTLSPPEEYKDLELEEQQILALQQIVTRGQRAPVCSECSATHEVEDDEGTESGNEETVDVQSIEIEEMDEKEKTDQSQQTTPTTPPTDNDLSPNAQHYIMDTQSVTSQSENRAAKIDDDVKISRSSSTHSTAPGDSPISGILKGGRLWKQASVDSNNFKSFEIQQTTDSSITSDDECGSKRSVRFIESDENRTDFCDKAPAKVNEEYSKKEENVCETKSSGGLSTPESTEMMLTFKLGNHVLISNNSLKPNSAVRQLFPCTNQATSKTNNDEAVNQYLVTAESLRAFEEAKRAKLPQIIQSGESDDSIRRAIERNTLRRSLIRYEPRTKKIVQKTDNSLVERIKQLTCNVDEVSASAEMDENRRATPPGEEARKSPELITKNQDKSFSPSSSSTSSSNSSSVSSTYRKITDLFGKRGDKPPDIQNVNETSMSSAPDLGNGTQELESSYASIKANTSGETRKQFLSTLAPLTACVSGVGLTDDYYYHMNHGADRTSVASSVGTEYSLEDIDEILKEDEEDSKRIAPDVLAGTPSASESGDELATFVQQDAGRIERIKKKYLPDTAEEDDEHDDYGFNRRPSVRGIKPRFSTTTEIFQQIQNQMSPPHHTPPRNHLAWPYYSETNLTSIDKSRNINQNPYNYQYPNASHQFRPTYNEESIYQNCANQRCDLVNYGTNVNVRSSPIVRVGCADNCASLVRSRNGRPQSPPPQEVSKNCHQTMVYIPYNHIEGYRTISPNPYYSSSDCYARVSTQNQINKRYIEQTYQQRIEHPVEDCYSKPVQRPTYSSTNHLSSTRSESLLPGHFSTARSTQTPVVNTGTCGYYPQKPIRYRPVIGTANNLPANGLMWQSDGTYVSKINKHNFPLNMPRYPPSDSVSLTDSDSQHSRQLSNGYRQPAEGYFLVQKESMPNSPTKPKFIERGVPEGAASVSPQDTNSSHSTKTSPTSPQNPPPQSSSKPLFYSMNV